MAYAVIRTDLMSGTKQPADLVSLRFYDASGKRQRWRTALSSSFRVMRMANAKL